MAAKLQLNAELVRKAVEEHRPASMSALYRALGGKSNPAGSTIKAIRELVPEIGDLLKACKTPTESPKEPKAQSIQPTKGPEGKAKPAYPRHPANPFRPSTTGYSLVFDILASRPEGMRRDELQELYAKTARPRKSLEKARFDCAVVLSPKGESPTSERHRSAREGYGLIKEGSFVKLVLP